MVTDIVIALIASMVSGLGGAILNQYANRKRTKAEIENLLLDTQRLRAELNYKVSSVNEIIVYDSDKSLPIGHDFSGEGSRIVVNNALVGNKATAELGFLGEKGDIISICRTNNDGRYQVRLKRYYYEGGDNELLSANVAISGKRLLRVSCEAKVSRSPHSLNFAWRAPRGELGGKDKRITISQRSWTRFESYFEIDPTTDCYLRIDDYYETGAVPSEVQIRKVVVAERKVDG